MACFNHPDKEAIATCSVCGKQVCSDCHVEIGGNSYCKDCISSLINSNSNNNEKAKEEVPIENTESKVVPEERVESKEAAVESVDSKDEVPIENTESKVVPEERVESKEAAVESVDSKDEVPKIENIEPITEPKTVPFEEPVESVEVKDNVPKNDPTLDKSQDNFEPEYDYETQYVESYGDGTEEDSYYENPEFIPEPKEEYQVIKEQIIGSANPKDDSPIINVKTYEDNLQNDYFEPQPIDNDLESKYEKYLDDIYYDEDPNYVESNNFQYADSSDVQYNDPVYDEPINNQYAEPVYADSYGEPVYQESYDDLEYIVPVHNDTLRDDGASYEEIKRKLEEENLRKTGQTKYNSMDENQNRMTRNENYDRKPVDDIDMKYSNNNLDDIQRMHNDAPKNDNSFTTVEIILTVILIILIIIVGFYVIYLFALNDAYATVFDAVKGLFQNPGLFISNLIY